MYHRILVAIDDSEFGEQALNQALMLAEQSQARLLLLHVLRKAESLSLYACEADTETESQACLTKLRVQADKVRAAGSVADLRLLSGHTGQQICETADRWGADLILMGHQHLAAFDAQSVSSYVIHYAPCPVLTLPDRSSPDRSSPDRSPTVNSSNQIAQYELAM